MSVITMSAFVHKNYSPNMTKVRADMGCPQAYLPSMYSLLYMLKDEDSHRSSLGTTLYRVLLIRQCGFHNN